MLIVTLKEKIHLLLLLLLKKYFIKNNQEACLIIKTKNLSRFESILKRITDISNNNSSIILIDEKFSNEKLDSLLIHSDCLISLHRSEGFGLTMAEAMQLGKPVIATAYSGNLDFMNSFNSYLVNYKLIEVKEDFGLIKRGMIWADPIMSDASEKIKQVFDNQKKATEVGKIAYDTISKNLSLESIGIKMEERLNFY
jgi:glycosyltransferase involved in cell wall biosynthesis